MSSGWCEMESSTEPRITVCAVALRLYNIIRYRNTSFFIFFLSFDGVVCYRTRFGGIPIFVGHGNVMIGIAVHIAQRVGIISNVYLVEHLFIDGLKLGAFVEDVFIAFYLFHPVGSEYILMLGIVSAQYQSGQSAKFPWSLTQRNIFGIPGTPLPTFIYDRYQVARV